MATAREKACASITVALSPIADHMREALRALTFTTLHVFFELKPPLSITLHCARASRFHRPSSCSHGAFVSSTTRAELIHCNVKFSSRPIPAYQ